MQSNLKIRVNIDKFDDTVFTYGKPTNTESYGWQAPSFDYVDIQYGNDYYSDPESPFAAYRHLIVNNRYFQNGPQ